MPGPNRMRVGKVKMAADGPLGRSNDSGRSGRGDGDDGAESREDGEASRIEGVGVKMHSPCRQGASIKLARSRQLPRRPARRGRRFERPLSEPRIPLDSFKIVGRSDNPESNPLIAERSIEFDRLGQCLTLSSSKTGRDSDPANDIPMPGGITAYSMHPGLATPGRFNVNRGDQLFHLRRRMPVAGGLGLRNPDLEDRKGGVGLAGIRVGLAQLLVSGDLAVGIIGDQRLEPLPPFLDVPVPQALEGQAVAKERVIGILGQALLPA